MRKYLALTPPVRDPRRIPDFFDTYVIGSDQVWNPGITAGCLDQVFLAGFPFGKGGRKYVSYAASVGDGELSRGQLETLASALCRFDAVSVREESVAGMLQPYSAGPLRTVLDPVFLPGREVWEAVESPRTMKGKYILVYLVKKTETVEKVARRIAEQLGAKVVMVSSFLVYGDSRDYIQTASPADFLSLVRYAECVVSTSFHGTAFSVIYGRPFYSVCPEREGGNTRVVSLLGELGLAGRCIMDDTVPDFLPIDYGPVYLRLEEMRRESCVFLERL